MVKISDKIAYLGRDIEDALKLHIIKMDDLKPLLRVVKNYGQNVINTSVIMHEFIIDLIENSSVDRGICMSEGKIALMKEIKDFNYEHIYHNKKLNAFAEYSKLIIHTIFEFLMEYYNGEYTLETIKENTEGHKTLKEFYEWVIKYCECECVPREDRGHCQRYENKKIYGKLSEQKIYCQAVLDYISGMTDVYAIDSFNDIITF